jgi:7-cyano-7-deazaguanine reductase
MLKESPLGQNTVYVETYTPDLLYPVPRTLARNKTGISHPLPFEGVDIWNAYEISWLNSKGKPEIALAKLSFSCHSPNIVESKSLKLYLNSFNQTYFESAESVKKTIENDLTKIIQDHVTVELYSSAQFKQKSLVEFSGICLDLLDIETNTYQVEPEFLMTESRKVEETVYSDLLKSNCLATGQPDWGSVFIHYFGPKIDHRGLLKYLISFRNHNGFAEHCVEQIFNDITLQCRPEQLTVYARYTRRGGLDINPFRSNFEKAPSNLRQIRQ